MTYPSSMTIFAGIPREPTFSSLHGFITFAASGL